MTSFDPSRGFRAVRVEQNDMDAKVSRDDRSLKEDLTLIVNELVRQGITLSQARREFERQFIEASIRSNEGNLGRSAQCLGVHRNTLRNKVTDLGIQPNEVVAKTDERRRPTERSRRHGNALSNS